MDEISADEFRPDFVRQRPIPIHIQGGQPHRRVHPDRHVFGDPPLGHQLLDGEQQHLGAIHRECRNQHIAAARESAGDEFTELPMRYLLFGVFPVAVGGFDEHTPGTRRHFPIGEDGVIVPA